ncbi:MAG TPA: LCP family protein [Acidimicrobiales bacterium]|nr:LCP family protein [Acidimicrobiales bacterium]
MIDDPEVSTTTLTGVGDVTDVTDGAVGDETSARTTIRDNNTSPGMPPVAPPPVLTDELSAYEPRRGRLHRTNTRPWRTVAVAVVMVLIAAVIPALGAVAAKTIVDSREGRLVKREGRAADIVLPPTPAQLLVALDAAGAPESIAVASLSPGGQGGFLILIPTLLRVEVPGVGDAPLGSAYAAGGSSLLRQTVEGLLDVRLEQISILDATTWPKIVTGTVAVSFDDPIGTPGPDGRLDVLFPAGPASLTAADLPAAFGAHLSDESEAARLVRYQALWQAVLTSIEATTPPPPPTTSTVPTGDAQVAPPPLPVEEHLASLAAGSYQVEVLPVNALPGEPEAYTPDEGPMRLLVAESMPGAVSPPTNSARVRLVNTTGDDQAMLTAADLVLVLQANLVIASDDAPVAHTQVKYATPGFKGAAEFVAKSLGVGTVVQDATVVDGIDLTIVLGQDFEAQVAKHAVATSTTVTSTTRTTTQETIPAG